MSRYEHDVGTKGKKYHVVYGFDRMLNEYFLDVTDPSIEVTDEMRERGEDPRSLMPPPAPEPMAVATHVVAAATIARYVRTIRSLSRLTARAAGEAGRNR